ncbi:MAG: dephospho-CoA kinase [Clostridia bacterium]|nr:dephospho-CoA kinase [Clostridia bacterium]
MLVLGLTGQSGAGKGVFSHTAGKREGIYVLDTDITARQVVCKGQPCLNELTEFFGKEILEADGTLNRRKLAQIAFSDESKHQSLNRITHFYITKKVEEWLSDCREKAAVCAIIDAPLLFESGIDRLCHMTLGIIADYDIRIKRVMNRDKIDEKNARIRLDSQPDDEFFRQKCTHILENNSSFEDFAAKTEKFIDSCILSKI